MSVPLTVRSLLTVSDPVIATPEVFVSSRFTPAAYNSWPPVTLNLAEYAEPARP